MNRSMLTAPLNLGLIALLVVVTVAGFALVPAGASVPIHWGLTGEPDRFASREVGLLLQPAVCLLILALFWALERFLPAEQFAAGRHVQAAVIPVILVVMVVVQIAVVLTAIGRPVPIATMVGLSMALMLVVLGNALPKSRINRFAGIRLPSTLADPVVWQRTHRVTGRLMIATGVLLAVFVLLVQNPLAVFIAVMAAAILPVLAGLLWSRPRGG